MTIDPWITTAPEPLARFAAVAAPSSCPLGWLECSAPGVLKLTLQLLVCLTIALRCVALFGHLRRAWIADGLAGEFQRELRRRGLVISSPAPSVD